MVVPWGEAWDDGRPIYYRLPGENERYLKDEEFNDPETDPPIADWLTDYWDELLIDAKTKGESFYDDYLNPATCRADALDWLAQFFGFTGEYWDASWSATIKRSLLQNAYDFIWVNKGTRQLLEWLIETFNLNAVVYLLGEFRVDVSILDTDLIGGDPFLFYIVVGLVYLRTGPEWALLEKLRQLYTPIYCESSVVYDEFYCDFSVCGDPVFS